MPDNTQDFGGVTLDMSGIEAALLPKLISALASNGTFRTAMVQALMPDIRAQMATLARSTAGAGTTTPRTGTAT